MIQLDFFEKSEVVLLLEEVRKVRESSEKVRKSVFRRIAEFEKMIKEIRDMRETG